MYVSMPPYSLFAKNLKDFISRAPSLPKIEVDTIIEFLPVDRIATVNFVAIEFVKAALERINNKLPSEQSLSDGQQNLGQKESFNSSDVFIVHGHDDSMKTSVADFVHKIELNPIILHVQPDGGRTIIEKFHDCSDVGFAIILYSPDDEMLEGKKRARQNVVFEHGFFLGKLGRDKVVGLVKDSEIIELPSDLQGVLYKPFVDKWEAEVVKEMRHYGIEITFTGFELTPESGLYHWCRAASGGF
jgi:predicted nucleotide-binding protein